MSRLPDKMMQPLHANLHGAAASTCMDLAGEHTGTLAGAMNMAGNIGSFVSSIAFPYLLRTTQSAQSYFWIAAAINVAAIFCWLRVRPSAYAPRA